MQDLNQEHAAPGWRKPLIAALLLGGAVSAAAGIANAFHNSSDFQWSGAHLLLHHVDPWREELAGNPRGLIYKIQQPNYLPLLYVLISPVGLLSAVAAQKVWAFCNLAFLLLSLWGTNRFYGLRSFSGAGLVTALALMATPMRVAIGNGQQSLLVLLVWCLALQHVRLQRRDITIAGISYLKFSFAPPLVMYLWLKNGFRALLWSAIPALAGLIVVWLWMTHGHSLHQLVVFAFEPLKVAQHGYFPIGEDPNLMDQIEPFLWGHTLTMVQYTAIILTPSLLLTFLMLFNAVGAIREALLNGTSRCWVEQVTSCFGITLTTPSPYSSPWPTVFRSGVLLLQKQPSSC